MLRRSVRKKLSPWRSDSGTIRRDRFTTPASVVVVVDDHPAAQRGRASHPFDRKDPASTLSTLFIGLEVSGRGDEADDTVAEEPGRNGRLTLSRQAFDQVLRILLFVVRKVGRRTI